MKIISGSASLNLAKEVAKLLKIETSPANLIRFPDGELKVRLPKISDKRMVVLQSTSPPVNENLVELLLILDALKRTQTEKIIAVIPYFGYARQDKVFQKGEPLSAALVAKLIETAGARKIITLDLHSEKIKKFFKVSLLNITPARIIKSVTLLRICEKVIQNLVIVAPDIGAFERATEVAKVLKTKLVLIKKKRSRKTGKIEIVGIKRKLKGKNCLIVDDIISSGITLVKSAQYLKEKGAKKVSAFATHPVFSRDAPKLLQKSPLESIIVSNSIAVPKEKQFKKLKIISIVEVLANFIKGI